MKQAKAKQAPLKTGKRQSAPLTPGANSSTREKSRSTGATGAVKSDRKGGEAGLPVSASPLSLLIPTPPSLNEAFGNNPNGGRGRYPKPAYKNWQATTLWRINLQSPHAFAVPVVVLASVGRASLSADIDNRAKLILDVLKVAGVYRDDSVATGIAFVWSPLASTKRDEETRLLIVSAMKPFDVSYFPGASGRVGGWYLAEKEEN